MAVLGPQGSARASHPALRGTFQVANAAAFSRRWTPTRAVAGQRRRRPHGLITADNRAVSGAARRYMVVLDVAHNPAAARALAHNEPPPSRGRTFASFRCCGTRTPASSMRYAITSMNGGRAE